MLAGAGGRGTALHCLRGAARGLVRAPGLGRRRGRGAGWGREGWQVRRERAKESPGAFR